MKRKKISEVFPSPDYKVIPPEEVAKTNERVRKGLKESLKKYKK